MVEYRLNKRGRKKRMITVALDGSGQYTSLQAAIDALPVEGSEEDRTVFIRKGVYRERVIVHKNHVRIVGEDAEETVLTWSSFALQIHPDGTERTTFRSWTMMVCADDVTVENLTVRNDAGDGTVVGQAVAVYAAGDRDVWKNCRMIAHQDTLYCGPLRIPDVVDDLGSRVGCAEQVPLVQDGHPSRSRQYFERCYIQGDVDFIFGSYALGVCLPPLPSHRRLRRGKSLSGPALARRIRSRFSLLRHGRTCGSGGLHGLG